MVARTRACTRIRRPLGVALVAAAGAVTMVVQEALLRGLRVAYRPATVDAEPGLYALADPDRLLQVLSNLVANAVQHTGPDGRLTITVRRYPDSVAVEVADTGPGIPPDALPHVFERFYRVTGQGGGAGLGLAIVESLGRAMGAHVSVASTVGEGSRFTVILPPA